jgi:AraC-like DNA-binding protein/mannose-6-phosphate isomerase-like protein (cupin superfamily)
LQKTYHLLLIIIDFIEVEVKITDMRATFEALPLHQEASFRFIEINQPDGFDGHWHYHPELELKWVLEGVGQRMVGDHMEPFGPSDLILVGSNLSHCWRTAPNFSGNSRAYVVQFPQDLISQRPEWFSVQQMIDDSSRGVSFKLIRKTRKKLEAAFACLYSKKPGTLESFSAWVSILGELSILPRQFLASSGFQQKETEDDRLARAINLILDSADHPIGEPLFKKACREVEMTPSAFSRFFKRNTGRTFSHFLNEARISKASRLLVESEENVLSISLECGYGSLSHFNRVFAELKGESPGQWRRKFWAA